MGLNSLIMGLNWLINTLELLFIYYFRRYWEPSRKVPGEGNNGVPAVLGVSVDVRGMAKLNPHPGEAQQDESYPGLPTPNTRP